MISLIGNVENIPELEIENHILVELLISLYREKENDLFTKHLLMNAKPKIKFPITKHKLIYRGIKLVHDDLGNKWLEQRGEKISPVINPPNYEEIYKNIYSS